MIPYHLTPHPYSLLGLSLKLADTVLLILGIAISIHYARERAQYMKPLQKHTIKELKLKEKKKIRGKQINTAYANIIWLKLR